MSDETSVEQPEAEKKEPELHYGYTVGVNTDGSFVFQVHGQPGLVELLGLNTIADLRINSQADLALGRGNTQILKALDVVYGEMKSLKTQTNED